MKQSPIISLIIMKLYNFLRNFIKLLRIQSQLIQDETLIKVKSSPDQMILLMMNLITESNHYFQIDFQQKVAKKKKKKITLI